MVSFSQILILAAVALPSTLAVALPEALDKIAAPTTCQEVCGAECCLPSQICVKDEKFPRGHCVDRPITAPPQKCLPNKQCGKVCCLSNERCMKDVETGELECIRREPFVPPTVNDELRPAPTVVA
ncbi:hypothetical protein Dda_6209 [Drechslerella dactyloides]|uniref:Uncharacterized protein n=1 Tax=Drechslerella dactyloides TaxID=74499 RepID=A0AAD6IWN8_DREDA|nr:hypothetical protein Dda_6209 [Drechslerella dactyloides]